MSYTDCRLGRRLILSLLLFAGSGLASGALFSQAIGSQAENIQFTASWQTPQGVTQLNSYFSSPVNNSVGVTMVYLWAPG